MVRHIDSPGPIAAGLPVNAERMLQQVSYPFGTGAALVFDDHPAHRLQQPRCTNAPSARLRPDSHLIADCALELTREGLTTFESAAQLCCRAFQQV